MRSASGEGSFFQDRMEYQGLPNVQRESRECLVTARSGEVNGAAEQHHPPRTLCAAEVLLPRRKREVARDLPTRILDRTLSNASNQPRPAA